MSNPIRDMTLDEYREEFRKKLDKPNKKLLDEMIEEQKEKGVNNVRVVGSRRIHKVYPIRESHEENRLQQVNQDAAE